MRVNVCVCVSGVDVSYHSQTCSRAYDDIAHIYNYTSSVSPAHTHTHTIEPSLCMDEETELDLTSSQKPRAAFIFFSLYFINVSFRRTKAFKMLSKIRLLPSVGRGLRKKSIEEANFGHLRSINHPGRHSLTHSLSSPGRTVKFLLPQRVCRCPDRIRSAARLTPLAIYDKQNNIDTIFAPSETLSKKTFIFVEPRIFPEQRFAMAEKSRKGVTHSLIIKMWHILEGKKRRLQ